MLNLFRERLSLAFTAADDQDRVVAANRADDVRDADAVERNGQRLGLSGIGPQHDKLLHRLESSKELGDSAAQHRFGTAMRVSLSRAGPPVRAVSGPLHQSEITDIP